MHRRSAEGVGSLLVQVTWFAQPRQWEGTPVIQRLVNCAGISLPAAACVAACAAAAVSSSSACHLLRRCLYYTPPVASSFLCHLYC